VEHCLESAEFMVCQDIFPTETTALPIDLSGRGLERDDGTFSNSERRVNRVRTVSRAPGQAKPNWWILRSWPNAWAGLGLQQPQEIWDNEVSHWRPPWSG